MLQMFGQHYFLTVLVYQDKLPDTAAVPAHHTVCCTETGTIPPVQVAQSRFTTIPSQSWAPDGSLCSIPLPLISFLLLRQVCLRPPEVLRPPGREATQPFWGWGLSGGGGEKALVPYPQLETSLQDPVPVTVSTKLLGNSPAQHSWGKKTSGLVPGMSLPRLCT